MMTLLRALHSIAARRGDGLRPEFLQMTTQSPPWPEIEKMAADGDPAETEESCASEVPRECTYRRDPAASGPQALAPLPRR
jgi:hypothetical protein